MKRKRLQKKEIKKIKKEIKEKGLKNQWKVCEEHYKISSETIRGWFWKGNESKSKRKTELQIQIDELEKLVKTKLQEVVKKVPLTYSNVVISTISIAQQMNEYQYFNVEELKNIFSKNLFRRSKQRMNLQKKPSMEILLFIIVIHLKNKLFIFKK